MAYGNGSDKKSLKRMADVGQMPMTADLELLRAKCLEAVGVMANVVYPADITKAGVHGKVIDRRLMRIQSLASRHGLNNVWAEKMRMMAKTAVLEQWKRAQHNLYGRFKHVASVGDTPMADGRPRLLNFPEKWSALLNLEDLSTLQALADVTEYANVMALFNRLRRCDAGLTTLQANALRGMLTLVTERYGCPVWKDDAEFQLHLDYRCVRGGAEALQIACAVVQATLLGKGLATANLTLTSHQPRGTPIAIAMSMPLAVMIRLQDRTDQILKSFVIELGPKIAKLKAVIVRMPAAPSLLGKMTVLADDFGFVNTSSMVLVRSKVGITQDRLDFVDSDPGKRAVMDYLSSNISGDDIEVLEHIQFSGRPFLDRIAARSKTVDRLRSEIDMCYARLERIRLEINMIAGCDEDALVPPEQASVTASNSEQVRYSEMHGRFFRLLAGIAKLKRKRKAQYASVAGLKKAWFGYIANTKAMLAEKYGAVVASEDLTILAIPTDDPAYKGRTFNRMMNNGSKGQYILRSANKLQWRGIAHIELPSYYSSSTDWRTGTVNKSQRRGEAFTAHDGTKSDADLHAAEMLARWLFLQPKPTGAVVSV